MSRKGKARWADAVPVESLLHLTAPSGVLARRPLVLTGGPAVGKTTTARPLAEALPRAAFIDVDDLRQLVVAGHETWGPQGMPSVRWGRPTRARSVSGSSRRASTWPSPTS